MLRKILLVLAGVIGGGMENVTPAYVEARLVWPIDKTVTVIYETVGGTATNGVDYNLPAGMLVFEPRQAKGRIRIPVIDDPCQECAETIVLRLSNPVNARLDNHPEHTYTITEICFPPFEDTNTAALWLFDETRYPYTTLTDAGACGYDLRLGDAGRLIAGKFGNALRMSPGSGYNLYYCEWKGIVCAKYMRSPDGQPSGLWGPTIAPKKLLTALAGQNWTCEFWLKLSSVPINEAAIVHLGHAYEPGVTLNLTSGATGFKISDAYGGFEAVCSTNASHLTDGQWHHVAFTMSGGQVKHYLDGRLQTGPLVSSIAVEPVPESNIPPSLASTAYGIFDNSKDYEKFRQYRFNLSIGEDRHGINELNGAIDELRVSDVVRYTGDFSLPDSFSRNYARIATSPVVPTGPPVLFGPNAPAIPVQLGSRKHIFIDEALVDTKQNVQLTINPPANPQAVSPNFGGDYWAVDHNDKVYMVSPDGYSSGEGITRLWVSEDGVNFQAPVLGLIEYHGTTRNNIVLYLAPMWASVFKDLNPNISQQEQFKLTASLANGGIYLYSSPDMIHWRRNETIMLPLVSGGGAETYWDDQRGCYGTFLKRDSSYSSSECPSAGGRTSVSFRTTEVWKSWPFNPMNTPYYEGWSLPAVTCEGPISFSVNSYGHVYRTRAVKYPWAPDAYLAFIWRMGSDNIRQTDLGVSRDGTNWTTYANLGMYMPTGGTFNGKTVVERLSQGGLIRRGDEIWQYAEYGTGPHGAGENFCVRVRQRLDGFVSITAGPTPGTVTTLPMVFTGKHLVLNLASTGSTRVAILDQAGQPIAGFTTTDCDPIQADSTRHIVTWNGNSDVSSLAGQVIRVRFEMLNAKIFALQFMKGLFPGDFDGNDLIDGHDLKFLIERWLAACTSQQ
jgi:hypothetical protein